MKIISNYDGASISIEEVNGQTAYLSLREEFGKYNHYYNFQVMNDENYKGFIHIKNISKSPYFKDFPSIPYIKTDDDWERLPSSAFSYQNNEVIITIEPFQKCEISLYPRYTDKHLQEFLSTLPQQKYIEINNPIDSSFTEIIMGNQSNPSIVSIGRQHPGETLSSFFIEGMINAIIDKPYILEQYCFIFYPIMNVQGVKNGDHRYTNHIDYNRSWNKEDCPQEIVYVKEKIKRLNIEYFIDVHNDEISKNDYIRTNYPAALNDIDNIIILSDPSKLRRFLRALIKQRKMIDVSSQTAREYITNLTHCKSFLIELSTKDTKDLAIIKGYQLIKTMVKSERRR